MWGNFQKQQALWSWAILSVRKIISKWSNYSSSSAYPGNPHHYSLVAAAVKFQDLSHELLDNLCLLQACQTTNFAVVEKNPPLLTHPFSVPYREQSALGADKLSFHEHTCGLENHRRITGILMMLCLHLTYREPWELPRALWPSSHVYGSPFSTSTELFLPSSTPLPRVDHFSGDASQLPKWRGPPSNYWSQLMEDSLPLIHCQYSSLPLSPVARCQSTASHGTKVLRAGLGGVGGLLKNQFVHEVIPESHLCTKVQLPPGKEVSHGQILASWKWELNWGTDHPFLSPLIFPPEIPCMALALYLLFHDPLRLLWIPQEEQSQ